ncbi:sialidase family protein [Lentzea sp.]|uniref:sialidase family protein n=1 Tax=Lentzea sp. TaxID=56099 RepID=UPI002B537517|nr:sialidase family protein [Lentzea sp.]HUQ60238.1 sialidase family protein [Lentzea sp.]
MNRRSLRPYALAVTAALLAATPLALATTATKPVTFKRVVLADQKAYGEPSLALSDDGKHIAICVPGGAGQTSVWYSNNDGKSFGTSHTTSDNGGGDCELDYLPNGTLLNADLEVTDSAIRYSKDFGKTWHGTQTAGVEQDRQWFAHSRDGKTAYLVYHDFVAEGEFYAQSNDGGMTWPANLAAQPVTGVDQAALPGTGPGAPGQPASLIDQGVNTFSGPMLLSPDGKDMYVIYSISDAKRNVLDGTPPFGKSAGIVVAHKGPEDVAFTNKYAVPNDTTSVSGAIFSWGAVDKAGTVYVLYNSDKGAPGHFHTYYAYSKDKAKTWSKPVKVDDAPMNRGAQIYATGDAGAPGVLDIAWYGHRGSGGSDDPTAVWDIHFAQVRQATSSRPQITRAKVAVGDPLHRGSICLNGLLCITGGDRSLADFFELQIGKDGMAQIAYADNYGEFADGKKGHVIWAKQTAGRSAYQP